MHLESYRFRGLGICVNLEKLFMRKLTDNDRILGSANNNYVPNICTKSFENSYSEVPRYVQYQPMTKQSVS